MHRIDKLKFLHAILIFLALLFLCLLAIHPFLTGSMLRTDDGAIHIYRSIVLDYSIQHDGVFYPRYSPALVYGYGAPLFNYFPPTAYYPTVFLHAIGLSWITAWKGTMILYVLIAAWGAYLLGREWTDELGGLITAAAFVYAPYTLFDTVTRGTSTEFAGMAFLPLALWAFTRLAKYTDRKNFVLAALIYSLFILLHNIMTLYGSVLLLLYCVVLLLIVENKKQAFWQMLFAGIFAVLITSFFWWPALAETNLVKINGVAANLDFIDVQNTLRSLANVFALPHTADPTQLQAPIPVSFSWPQIVLAVLGLFLVIFKKRTRYILPLQIFFLMLIALVTFSQLKLSADFWQSISILHYSQFAWRTMSIGTLALAILTGIGTWLLLDTIPQQSIKTALFCFFLTFIMLYAIPWLYRPSVALKADSVTDSMHYEMDTGELSLSSYSEYLPFRTDASALEPTRMLDFFASGKDIPRLNSNDNITVTDAQWSGTSAKLSLEVSAATTATFNWLYFEGWQATIDGKGVEVYPSGDAALVTVDIDAGRHQLEITLKDTPTEAKAVWLSRIAIGLFLLFAIFYPFPKNFVETSNGSISESPSTNSLYIAVILVGLALFTAKIALIDHSNNLFRAERFANGLENGVKIALNADFGDEIRLLGASPINYVKSGNSAEIRLFWTLADDKLSSDYSSLVELRDSQGIVIVKTGSFYIGGLATTEWLSGYYLEENLYLEIPATTPPGDYSIDVSVFQSQTGQTLNVLNADGNPVDVKASVSTLTVQRPDKPLQTDTPAIASDDYLSLFETNGLPEQAQVGDEMIVDWLFQMKAVSNQSSHAKLVWLDSDNQVLAETQSVDIVNEFPSVEWQAGDVWRGYHRFYVPGNLAAGQYTVAVQFDETLAPLTKMMVTVPERNYNIPEFENQSDAKWQNGIRLLGYDQTASSITLYWQTDTVLTSNLRLFVQVLDTENHVLALDDSIPVNWTRPTTSWDTGELIRTAHNFGGLTAGDYHLLIGWYDPLTGQRVLLDNGDDALIVAQ